MIAAIGVDPDLHNTAIAVVTKEEVLALGVIRVPKSYIEDEAVEEMSCQVYEAFLIMNLGSPLETRGGFVETQRYYGKALPEDLIRLAAVSGAALACFSSMGMEAKLVQPVKWKGSVDKTTNQARTLKDYGIGFKVAGGLKNGYCVPTTGQEKLPVIWTSDGSPPLQSDWKHVLDAVGIARWAVLGGRPK